MFEKLTKYHQQHPKFFDTFDIPTTHLRIENVYARQENMNDISAMNVIYATHIRELDTDTAAWISIGFGQTYADRHTYLKFKI